jgi:polyphosphate:AMP phosphotransferase
MFETAELGRKVDKQSYDDRVPELRRELVKRQFQLKDARKSAIVLITGDDGPSCNEVFNLFHEWMDPRFVDGHAFGDTPEAAKVRPYFWRFWTALPPAGSVGLVLRGWLTQPLVARWTREIDDETLARLLDHVRVFERELVDDGMLVLKFWLHLAPDEFRARVKKAKKQPEKLWRYGRHDPQLIKHYHRAMEFCETAVRETSTAESPWHLVESADARYRNLTVAESLLDGLTRLLETPKNDVAVSPAVVPVETESRTILDTVDLTRTLPKKDYWDRLAPCQTELFDLTRKARERGVTTVLVFEGWDAAGKGGIIRRFTQALDATLYRVVPIAAPNDEEQAHHYLWRFWRELPRAGRVTVFDRSWYGRVLVERVEGLATPAEWRRAYSEINDFEEQLIEHGVVLLKFWLHLDRDEQLRRFKAREQTPYKRYKITEEDYRNREHWGDYEIAVNEMVARTGTPQARWNLIAANDKRWARIEVLETVRDALARAVKKGKNNGGNDRD